MAMPAPPRMPPMPNLRPQLRLAQATARQAARAAPAVRKALWAVVVATLGVVIVLALLAGDREETDPDQAWFWTPEWQAGELEADQDIAAGRTTHYDSDEAWEASLRARLKPE